MLLWTAGMVIPLLYEQNPKQNPPVCAAHLRGFLVVTVVRGDDGPVPALLYARTATWYRVLGRSPDTLAEVS